MDFLLVVAFGEVELVATPYGDEFLSFLLREELFDDAVDVLGLRGRPDDDSVGCEDVRDEFLGVSADDE